MTIWSNSSSGFTMNFDEYGNEVWTAWTTDENGVTESRTETKYRKYPIPEDDCRVYWGSHGCELERGHKGGHVCDCCDCENHPDTDTGCVGRSPYYGWSTNFYGEDARQRPFRRALGQGWHRMQCTVPAQPRPLWQRRPWRPCPHE